METGLVRKAFPCQRTNKVTRDYSVSGRAEKNGFILRWSFVLNDSQVSRHSEFSVQSSLIELS
jgi:hypothetical protein